MTGWPFCSVILNVLLVEVLHHEIHRAQQRFRVSEGNNWNIQASIRHFTPRDKCRLSLIQFYDLCAVLRAHDTV